MTRTPDVRDESAARKTHSKTTWTRWRPVFIIAIVFLIAIWYAAKEWNKVSFPKTLGDIGTLLFYDYHWTDTAQALLQVGTTAFATVFVGTLTRNTSQTQADAAAKLSREQDSRSRSSDLMAHQASAIDHLGSSSPVIQAAAITEMVWLIRGWRHLTNDDVAAGESDKDKQDEEERRWKDHAQELVELAYRDNLHDETGFTPREIIQARAQGLRTLHDKLQDNFTELSFSNSKLTEADLTGANLTGADLYGADLTKAELDISEYDEFTKFPADFDPDAHIMFYVGSPAKE